MSYNGYANHTTWLVSLFLDGNHTGCGTYQEVRDLVQSDKDAARQDLIYTVSQTLQSYVEENIGDTGGIAGDLANAALMDVDWEELAENAIEE